MNNVFIQQCIDLLQKDDICSPVITLIFNILNPYIYIVCFVVFLIFTGILSNTVILIVIWRQLCEERKRKIID
jgi:hypothetical protein